MEEAISVIPQCSAHVLSLEGDGRKKLIRSIDDLSRVGEKVLRAANTPRDIRKLMQSLMGSLVKYGEQVLKGRADNNTVRLKPRSQFRHLTNIVFVGNAVCGYSRRKCA